MHVNLAYVISSVLSVVNICICMYVFYVHMNGNDYINAYHTCVYGFFYFDSCKCMYLCYIHMLCICTYICMHKTKTYTYIAIQTCVCGFSIFAVAKKALYHTIARA